MGVLIKVCQYCLQATCPAGCPNYIPPKASHLCSVCGDGIYDGDEYIVNSDGDYAHWDCVDYGRNLVEWLGYEIRTMEEYNN